MKSIETLEHYLQEVVGATTLASAPAPARLHIDDLAQLYDQILADADNAVAPCEPSSFAPS